MSQNLVLYAPFSENFAQKYPLVSPGAPSGNVVIAGGKLDMSGGPDKFVTFFGSYSGQQTGTIALKVTPTFTFAPLSETQFYFAISKAENDSESFIDLLQSPSDGALTLRIFDDTTSTIINNFLGYWNPVAGQEYEFELDYDLTVGATRFFIDGVQFGPTFTNTGTRGSLGMIRVGEAVSNQSVVSQFKIRDFRVYSDVTHGDNFVVIEPLTCRIFGVLRDMSGIPRVGAVLTFTIYSLISTLYAEAVDYPISTKKVSTTTGPDGYFQIYLIRSSQYDNAAVEYRVIITDSEKTIKTMPDGTPLKITVPDAASADLADLLTI